MSSGRDNSGFFLMVKLDWIEEKEGESERYIISLARKLWGSWESCHCRSEQRSRRVCHEERQEVLYYRLWQRQYFWGRWTQIWLVLSEDHTSPVFVSLSFLFFLFSRLQLVHCYRILFLNNIHTHPTFIVKHGRQQLPAPFKPHVRPKQPLRSKSRTCAKEP